MAALADLLARVQSSDTLDEACHVLANTLQAYLRCTQVFVGVCAEGSATCRVAAISQMVTVPRQGETVQAVQAAMHEVIARNTLTMWPATDATERHALLAHARCAAALASGQLVSSPLRDEHGNVRGAWIVSGPDDVASREELATFLRAAESPMASTIHLLGRADRGRALTRLTSVWTIACGGRKHSSCSGCSASRPPPCACQCPIA